MLQPNDDTLERLAARIASIMQDMSDEAVAVICRRLSDLGELSPDDIRSLARMHEVEDLTEIAGIISDHAKLADAALKEVYEAVADLNDKWAKPYYEAANVPYSRWSENAVTNAILQQAYASQSQGLINLASTSAFSYGGTVKTVQAAYYDAVNKAVLAVSTGVSDYRSAIRKTVRGLADSGLRAVQYAPGSHAEALAKKGVLSVQYPSGRTLRVDSAARMATMDGFRATMGELREQQGREFGADGVEISAHALCAPDHVGIQGRQFYSDEWDYANARLDRKIGTMNCKHIRFPVIVGVSSHTYSEEQLKEMANYSDTTVTWTGLSGKEMSGTRYEATQYQRNLEASLRTKKSEARSYSEVGDDEEARRCRTQARALQAEYRDISDQMGLSTKPWRTR